MKSRRRESSLEVEAQTERTPTGMLGPDYLLRGGLPAHRIHLIEGHPGAGRTSFGGVLSGVPEYTGKRLERVR